MSGEVAVQAVENPLLLAEAGRSSNMADDSKIRASSTPPRQTPAPIASSSSSSSLPRRLYVKTGRPSSVDQLQFPEPLSLKFRLCHGLPYAITGVFFLYGSTCYYPDGDPMVGGLIFCIGGIAFLWSDCLDWYNNNRVGCFRYEKYRESYEKYIEGKGYAPANSEIGMFQRAENGINYGISILGSGFYCIGGFFFIPSTHTLLVGLWIFILGSAVIMISQSWKLYRFFIVPYCEVRRQQNQQVIDDIEVEGNNSHVYDFDSVSFSIDFFSLLGGFTYFFGCIYFLPWIDHDRAGDIVAANWFTCGGAAFAVSGLSLLYRYFIQWPPRYPHQSQTRQQIIDAAPNTAFTTEADHVQ